MDPRTPRAGPGLATVIALGSMLLPLNSTMVAVALPDVVDDLHASLHGASWLVGAYLIAMAALQPVAGKLGDRVGRGPLMMGGLGAFGAASALAPLAPGLGALIALRLVQAAAGAVVFPNAMALLRDALPNERRAAGFGLLGAAIGLAAAVGPPLGGVLVAAAGWRGIFWVNVPLVAIALAAGARALPRRERTVHERPFDTTGAVWLCLLLAGCGWALNPGGAPAAAVVAVAIAVVLGTVAFARRELRHPDPVVQPRVLRRGPFAAATAAVGLSNLAMYTTLLAVPVLLDARAGWSSARIGLVLLALSGAMVISSPVGGRLADARGRRFAAVAGLTLLTVGLVPLAAGGADVTIALLLAGLAGAGAGLGLANAALQTAALESLPPGDAGTASGVFSTGRYLGSITSAGMIAGLVHAHSVTGFGTLFVLTTVAAGASALLATALPRPVVTRAPAAGSVVA